MTTIATPNPEQEGTPTPAITPAVAATTTTTVTKQTAAKPAAKSVAKKPSKQVKAEASPKAVPSKPAAAPAKAVKKIAVPKSPKIVAPSNVDKIAKPKKPKLIRDSFTMPESEYELIASVKKRCIVKGLAAKKSEVIRAAIIDFAARSDAAITAALEALVAIKTGRPPKDLKHD
jgi:hypothetical protein